MSSWLTSFPGNLFSMAIWFYLPNREEIIKVFSNFYFGGNPTGESQTWKGFIKNEPLLVEKTFFEGQPKFLMRYLRWNFPEIKFWMGSFICSLPLFSILPILLSRLFLIIFKEGIVFLLLLLLKKQFWTSSQFFI